MTLFEYLAVAASIILSSAILRLLSGIQSASNRDRGYWVVTVWIGIKIIAGFNLWWGLWLLREGVDWNSLRFIVFLLPPLLMHFQATTLVPSHPEVVTSWREHFEEVRRWFFALNCVLIVVGVLGFGYLTGAPGGGPIAGVLVTAALFVLSLAGAMTSNLRFHSALALIFVLMQIVQLVTYYDPAPSLNLIP